MTINIQIITQKHLYLKKRLTKLIKMKQNMIHLYLNLNLYVSYYEVVFEYNK